MKDKKRAVTILLHNEDGDILAVSRKDNENDFGLPGGKVDEGETDEQAIIREVREETGLEIFNVRPYFEREDDTYVCTTFIGNYIGEITTTEKGKVKWTDWSTIQAGSFGEYNIILETFFNKNFKYQQNDLIVNVGTGEAFKIKHCVENDSSDIDGYFLTAFCSQIGNSFVKKSAIDNVKMQRVPENTTTEYMQKIGLFDYITDDARLFACASHFDANQYYGKNGSLLYSYHLKKTVDVGRRYKHLIPEEDWVDVEAGLWNHDNIEDARNTYNDLVTAIGKKGADISFALSNSDGKTREERADAKYYGKIRNTKYADFGKICDRIANVEYSLRTKSSMFLKYKKEHDHFKNELFLIKYHATGQAYNQMWKDLEELFLNDLR